MTGAAALPCQAPLGQSLALMAAGSRPGEPTGRRVIPSSAVSPLKHLACLLGGGGPSLPAAVLSFGTDAPGGGGSPGEASRSGSPLLLTPGLLCDLGRVA